MILPVRRLPLRFLPGRHMLGRAGEGMRFLRSRPFEPLEDNPRDIDKFSPRHGLMVNEWEHETQAEILILADVSASMAYPPKTRVRNNLVLQLIYSLWRAGDRVRVAFFADRILEEIHEANLRSQMERCQQSLADLPLLPVTDVNRALAGCRTRYDSGQISVIILVSDFVAVPELPAAVTRRMGSDLIPVIVSFRMGEGTGGVGRVWDPERRRQGMVMLTRARRARINAAERARVASLGRVMRAAGLDFIAIEQQRQVFPMLSNLARTREKRRL